jgi:hypothetical protein
MTSSSSTEAVGEALHFAVGGTRPEVPGMEVFDRLEATLLGAPVEVSVIGSSHFLAAPELGFYETASCKPVRAPDATTFPLSRGLETTVTVETDAVSGRSVARGEPLSSFPGERSFDLRYDFGPEATTAIDLLEDGLETYHTYPEFDLSLYTETRLRRVE